MDTEKTITVAGVEATLVRRRVKNMRVTVLPPDGAVRVVAPKLFPEATVRAFLAQKADWIKKHQTAIRSKHANEPKRYESGEPIPLFGMTYVLTVRENQKKNGVTLEDGGILLSLRKNASPEQREAILNAWYRERLKTEIEYLLPLWSERMGLVPSGWTVRDMRSRWGTCNTQTGKLTFNLQLVRYPAVCLEYVILHELAHLRVRGHGADFKALLDAYMPSWRDRRKRLNG